MRSWPPRRPRRPRCVFPEEHFPGTEVAPPAHPHAAPLLRLADVLQAAAAVAEPDEAGPLLRAGWRLAEATSEEPSLESQLLRSGLHGAFLRSFERTFPSGAEAGRDVASDPRAGFQSALIGDFAAAARQMLLVGRSDPARSGGLLQDVGYLVEGIREAVELLDRPAFERRDATEAFVRARIRGAPPYAEFAASLLGFLDGVLAQQPVLEARVAAVRIAGALAAHRAERGAYPGALEDFGPAELPPDPFSGKSFRYRREGAGFVLYSVGPDGTDDGGVSRDRDLVFRASR